MSSRDVKISNHLRRKKRIRQKVFGTAARPRLTVYRSLQHIYAQLVDDAHGTTILGVSTRAKELQGKVKHADTIEAAKQVGEGYRIEFGPLGLVADSLDQHPEISQSVDTCQPGSVHPASMVTLAMVGPDPV